MDFARDVKTGMVRPQIQRVQAVSLSAPNHRWEK